MESAYVLANRELEGIRNKNREAQEVRRAEAALKDSRFAELDAELMRQGTRLLNCVLKRNDDFEAVREKIRALQRDKAALLEKHGFSKDYLDDIFRCERCRDTGFVDGRRCECLKSLVVKYTAANSNLTDYMREQRFESFDMSLFANQGEDSQKTVKIMRIICDKAMEFAESFDKTGENFLIMGNAGTGKTFISSCIANRALERGRSVYYQTAFRLFEIFENVRFNKGDDDSPEVVKYVYDVDLLIIDDLGTEFSTQYTSAALFDIINSRLISGKSTIVSSNLGFEELSAMYSQRVVSRFMGDYRIYQTVGKDLRAMKRVKNKNL